MKRSPKKSSAKLSQSSGDILNAMNSSHKKPNNTGTSNKAASVQVRLHNTDSFTTYRNKYDHLAIDQMALATHFEPDDIDDDDDIWLCEVPNGIDVNEFIGKSIKLGGTSKTISTSDGGHFECVSEVQKNGDGIVGNDSMSIVLQNHDAKLSIKNVKVQGRLTFRHKLDDDASDELQIDDNIAYKAGTEFPKNLRVRHPLYGFQYDQYIDLDAAVKQKFQDIRDGNDKAENEPTVIAVKAEKQTPTKAKKRKVTDVDGVDGGDAGDTKRAKINVEAESIAEDLAWIRQI